tara:strand:- start:694 stop:810 length:117 start_codon:yes stop_codon:yes gene_type:complete
MPESLLQRELHHLPYLLPGPDGSDQMFTMAVIFLLIAS